MTINLFALGLNRAEITRTTQDNTFNKISTSSVKEKVEELKSQSNDILELSGKDVTKLNTTEGLRIMCDYSSDVFFTKDMPDQVNENGNFVIGHTEFSKEELEQCRAVMKSAVENMGVGAGNNIDYRNYAEMGISYNIVKNYAENTLTKEQSTVVTRAMEEYNDSLISLEKEIYSKDDFISSSEGELSKYYGIKHILSEEEVNWTNEFSVKYGYGESQISAGLAVTVHSATNTEIINNLTDIFSNMDINDKTSLNKAFSDYRELVTPVYLANWQKQSDAIKMLNEDISNFKTQIENVLVSTNYKAMNVIV